MPDLAVSFHSSPCSTCTTQLDVTAYIAFLPRALLLQNRTNPLSLITPQALNSCFSADVTAYTVALLNYHHRPVCGCLQKLRSMVHEIVGRINGHYGTLTHVPIHHLDRQLSFHELCALYAITDVALVTSLRDGMNLVSYEYVACQTDNAGELCLCFIMLQNPLYASVHGLQVHQTGFCYFLPLHKCSRSWHVAS